MISSEMKMSPRKLTGTEKVSDLQDRHGTMGAREAVSSLPSPGSFVQTQSAQNTTTNAGKIMNMSFMMGSAALLLLLPLVYTIWRYRKRSQQYEGTPGAGKGKERQSRCSQGSICSSRQQTNTDFVLTNESYEFLGLPSSVAQDALSITSSESTDMPLWARLALLEPGPTLLGGLNPELYRMGEEQPEEEVNFPEGNVGRVWIGASYDSSMERLAVTLIKVKNLPSRVYGCVNYCDPFVRLYLLPDGRRYVQSRIKKKTCSPIFEENFVFQVPSKNLEERVVKVTVFDNDRGKRYNVVGHAFFPLKEMNLNATEALVSWKDLVKDSDEPPSDLGEVMVSLCYNDSLERLTITVCEAKGLRIPDGQTTVDSFAKLILMQANKAVKTKKTVVVKNTTEPKYNESFHFRLQQKSISSSSVVLQITAASGLHKGKPLGRIVFGPYMFVRGKTLQHWNEAISVSRKQIRYWHKLTI